MKTTIDYLDEAKQRLGIISDYRMAQWLGMTNGGISHYRTRKRIIDNYIAVKLAEALGINAMEVIATAEAEREKEEERQSFWREIARKTKGAIAVCVTMLALEASNDDQYDQNGSAHNV